jgi:hypothetical protein
LRYQGSASSMLPSSTFSPHLAAMSVAWMFTACAIVYRLQQGTCWCYIMQGNECRCIRQPSTSWQLVNTPTEHTAHMCCSESVTAPRCCMMHTIMHLQVDGSRQPSRITATQPLLGHQPSMYVSKSKVNYSVTHLQVDGSRQPSCVAATQPLLRHQPSSALRPRDARQGAIHIRVAQVQGLQRRGKPAATLARSSRSRW